MGIDTVRTPVDKVLLVGFTNSAMMSPSAAAMDPSRLKELASSHPGLGDSALNNYTLKKIKSSTSDSKLNLLEIMRLHNV